MATKGNILIIDDEIEVLNTLKRIFRRDYEVHITESPQEALRIMENYDIGVILCDQRMPEMRGTDFFQKVKDLYPDTIRILITAYSELSDVITSINEARIFKYVTKPWDLFDLKTTIEEAFDKFTLVRENLRMLDALKNTNIVLEQKVQQRTQELEDKNKELQKISDDKSQILGIVAHDLRDPICVIYSLTNYIYAAVKEKTSLEPLKYAELNVSLEFLESVTNSSNHLLELINNILDVSAIETGKLTLHLENIHYLAFLNKVISIDKELAKNKNIIVLSILDIQDNLTIHVDAIKISQVIHNFLQNAIKFSQPLGTIILKVEDDGEYITTKVFDDGEGIPESQRDKLFKIFSKTSTAPTGGESSNGLGLYISKRNIEAHGGIIGYEENINGGSIFYFKLKKT